MKDDMIDIFVASQSFRSVWLSIRALLVKVFTQIYRALYGDSMFAGDHTDGYQHGGSKVTETCVIGSANVITLDLRNIAEINFSSRARTVHS